MPSWWDSLFGDVPLPARPTSRGAMLGMNFRDVPSSPNIEDRRSEGPDYAIDMQRSRGDTTDYWPTDIKGVSPWGAGQFRGGYDPLVAAPLIATRGLRGNTPGAYAPSFPQNLKPPRQPSYPRAPIPRATSGSDLPYIGAHLPWGPGELGWTPPTGLTLNSNPWGQ